MKKIYLLLVLVFSLLQTVKTLGQNNTDLIERENSNIDYIYIKGKDTIFCIITTINRHQNGKIHHIKYIDAKKQEHEIGSEKSSKTSIAECEKVLALRIMGYRMELLPESVGKPNGEKYHREIVTSGAFTVYCTIELSARLNKKNERVLSVKYVVGTKYTKYPDGKIGNGWDKDKLEEFFSKCNGLKYDKLSNNSNSDPLITIKEYNKAGCK